MDQKYNVAEAVEELKANIGAIPEKLVEEFSALFDAYQEKCQGSSQSMSNEVNFWSQELDLGLQSVINALTKQQFKTVHCHLWQNMDFLDVRRF